MKKSAKKNKMTIKNKKRFCIMIFIIMAVIILMALIINGIFGNKYGDAGRVKDGVVTYSEKIVNTTYNKENNNKVVTIQSVNDLIDDCIISNENIAEMKNKDSKYQKTLNEILANENTSNKEIYNIRKAIELKYVDENTKYAEFYAKITGFKNSKSLIKFCENTFKLMEIENKN